MQNIAQPTFLLLDTKIDFYTDRSCFFIQTEPTYQTLLPTHAHTRVHTHSYTHKYACTCQTPVTDSRPPVTLKSIKMLVI